jgi:diphthamide synthase (EF-2-diphthine--ammonia ligase)
MGLPLEGIPATWGDYEVKFIAVLKIKTKYDLEAAVLILICNRTKIGEDKVCAAASLKAILPLWQQDQLFLVNQMLENGIVTMIVSCNTMMENSIWGKF